MAFDFSFVVNLIPIMAKYSGVTLKLSSLAIVCGFMLSMMIAFVMYARVMILSQFFRIYISFFRGTPFVARL